MRTVAAALVFSLLLVCQQPEAIFKVTSTLVQIDAVVTDSKGRYVSDLKAQDFEVYQDGKLQDITNFWYVQVGSKTGPRVTAPAAPLRREEVRRTFVLMVDDLGLSFESMAFVRRALGKFVETQMQPGDLMAVCQTGSGSGALQQLTADKRVLLAVIDGLRWNPNGRSGVSFLEPYGKYGKAQGPVQAAGEGQSIDSVYDIERNTAFTVGTLGAVSYIVTALRELPGRKSIVLFSDGISLFTETQRPMRHVAMGSSAEIETNAEITAALHNLIDHANRSGTVLYTVHTLGLQPLAPDAGDNVDLGGRNAPGAAARHQALQSLTEVGAAGGRDDQLNAEQQGLGYLADKTGGLSYENGNDLNYALDRVMKDQQGYYLIGYKPADTTFQEKHGTRDYHGIRVKVKGSGLHVRSRTGFFGETDEEARPKYDTPVEQMRAAMLSPFQSAGVRLRLTALYTEEPKRGAVVRNLLYIDARDLKFQRLPGGPPTARVDVLAVATGAGDERLTTVAREYEFEVAEANYERVLKQGAVYTLEVPVKRRGAYQIRVAVRDESTGKVGSATQFIEIPEVRKGRLALSSILLQDGQRQAGEAGMLAITPARRQFHRGGQVEYLCAIQGRETVESQIRIMRDGKNVYAGPARLVAVEGGGQAISGTLKLGETMTPGDYFVQVVARGGGKGKGNVAAQWTDFEVVP